VFWRRVYLQVDADVSELPVTFLKATYWSASRSHIPSLWLVLCTQPLLFRSYIKPSMALPCHFSRWRWRQHGSVKRRHRPANTHGAKTQDPYNTTIIALRTSNLINKFLFNYIKLLGNDCFIQLIKSIHDNPSSETDSGSAGLLWNLKFHQHVYNSSSLDCV
jgi:hypothetical protein